MSVAIHEPIDGDRSKDLYVDGALYIHQNVIAALPEGGKVISTHRFGSSAWRTIARITVQLPNGLNTNYFIKYATADSGRSIIEGEFNAMSELYKWAPDFVPTPYAWGRSQASEPEIYFLKSIFGSSNLST